MTQNALVGKTSRNTLFVLLALGLTIGAAALAPAASAACSVIDGRGGDPSVDVIVVAGGSGCTYDGHEGDYAEAFGYTILA